MLNKTSSLPARFPLPRRTRPAFLGMVLKALSIWRERQTLRDIDDHILNDIGLTRSDIETETKRPFWDAPDRWMQ